jgi:hypothetical protein
VARRLDNDADTSRFQRVEGSRSGTVEAPRR